MCGAGYPSAIHGGYMWSCYNAHAVVIFRRSTRLFVSVCHSSWVPTAGALYYLMLTAASASLAAEDASEPLVWAKALLDGALAVSQYGGASEGDCTMLDVLLPAGRLLVEQLSSGSAVSPPEALRNVARLATRQAKAVRRRARPLC